jgi:ATP-dependent Clp protease protease subunit
MERAKELGFIHEIIEPASASARGWKRPIAHTSSDNMSNKKTLASAFKAIAEALGLSAEVVTEPAPVGYVLTAQDGTEINIEKEEGEDPAVGDVASPDGEFLMPDGTTIVIADGVITEIRDAEVNPDEESTEGEEEQTPEEDETVAALNAEIASLQARIAELEGSQMSAEQNDIVAKVQKAGGVAWLDKTLKSGYTPAARQRNQKPVASNKIADDLAALKAKRARK